MPSDLRRGDAPCRHISRHDEIHDRMSILVRHLARQAARQLFRDSDARDCPQAVFDHTMPEHSD